MKKLTGTRDYLCIAGKASDITANLNKIEVLYDFEVLSSALDNGIVMVVIERRQKSDAAGSAAA